MQEIVITYTSQWKKRNGKTKESVETNWKRNMYLRLANKNEEEEKKIDDEDGEKRRKDFPADRRTVTVRHEISW